MDSNISREADNTQQQRRNPKKLKIFDYKNLKILTF
jgi:hypothetical protein